MFALKKIVSRLLFPLPLSLEIMFLGLYLIWFTRKQRHGKALVTLGVLMLTAMSYFFTANVLIRPLERRYPSVPMALRLDPSTPAPQFVVVLGGYANYDPRIPISSRISAEQMVRFVEGFRLHRELPGSKLILSGDNGSAEGMSQLAQALGVSPQEIIPLPMPRDTEDEAHQVASLVGDSAFILVTSAAHMPRAMGLFKKLGLQPLPAPTDYLAPQHRLEPDSLFPNAFDLFKSQTAIYEYLGLAWARLRGKL